MKLGIFMFVVAAVALFFPVVGADVISVNSGGSTNITISSDSYIEGFFTSGVSISALCGNGVLESGEECDDGNTNSGDGCSSICQTEESGGSTETGGGGGGGVVAANIKLSPSEFNIDMAINTNVRKTVSVRNLDSSPVTVGVSQSGLNNLILISNSSLTIGGGETKYLDVVFVAPEDPGTYTGFISVGGKLIPVALNVKTKLLLFDSNIVVLNRNYVVPQGDKLRTKVTLIPMGDDARLDVTLNYKIKDYEGNVYLTRSETVLVEEQVDFKRDFDTGNLPFGDYIVALELVYPNGVAPSSAHFEIAEAVPRTIVGTIILYLIIAILILAIMITIVLISRSIKRIRMHNG
jgi:cysteine-rich repeat protein